MCQRKPGPRCSYHAHKRVLRTQKKVSELTELQKNSFSPERVEQIVKAKSAFYDAVKEFDATPRGQQWLETELSRTQKPQEVEALTLRKLSGKMLYEWKKNALNATQSPPKVKSYLDY